jgi:hypothetical protein
MANLIRSCFDPCLKRLDRHLHLEILRLRARYQLSLDEFRGLYISDQQVDHLVRDLSKNNSSGKGVQQLTEETNLLTELSHKSLAADQIWSHLASEFRLCGLEQDLLILPLALELNPKYEILYAYLNNDITRKYPTVDLAIRLFGQHDPLSVRTAMSLSGRLFDEHLLDWHGTDAEPASISTGFKLAPAVRGYLLGLPPVDPHLHHFIQYHHCPLPVWEQMVFPNDLLLRLQGLARLLAIKNSAHFIVMEGETGVGRLKAAQAVLGAAGKSLICADLWALSAYEQPLLSQAQRLTTQARLTGSGLFLRGLGRLMSGEPRDRRALKVVLRYFIESPVTIFFPVPPDISWRSWLREKSPINVSFEEPNPGQRERLWGQALNQLGLNATKADVAQVADRFLLNSGQIGTAAAALQLYQQITPGDKSKIIKDQLFAAAREQSIADMGKSAQKVKSPYRWEDLVLPVTTMQRVREIVAAIHNRNIVYRDWDMQCRMGDSQGLMILFSGASGTGKTMCASVIAKEIGLDLYRIDLSNVVSKYIGETEKNLDRIFTASHRANCILFFDEADALFGKRTEVKDAHDRYANIEVAYLLQKLEEHDGTVILATNIVKNLDQAFARRMHFSVEFPRPNAEQRESLWYGMFPSRTPLAEDIDFSFLARHFDITGGDIKSVALEAAMMAVGNGQILTMACLINAMARQMIKQGRIPSATDFKQYFTMVEQP